MKNWIFKNRKPITVLLVVITFLNIFTIGTFAYDNPNSAAPIEPNGYTYSTYYPGGFGYQAPQPLYKIACGYLDRTASPITPHTAIINNVYARSLGAGNYITQNSTLRDDNTRWDTDMSVVYDMYYRYDVTIRNGNIVIPELYFNLGDFPYFIYEGYNRPIFYMEINNLNDQVPYSVTGSFRFLGNLNVHTFNYTLTSSGGYIIVLYDDLVRRSGALDNYDKVYPDVPIIINNMRVFVNVQNAYSHNFTIDVPFMGAEEGNFSTIEANTIYNATLNIAQHDLKLDLDWIIRGVNGFMNGQLAAGITFGGIFLLSFTMLVGVAILKFLNHLK